MNLYEGILIRVGYLGLKISHHHSARDEASYEAGLRIRKKKCREDPYEK